MIWTTRLIARCGVSVSVLLAVGSLTGSIASADGAVDPCAHARALYLAHYYAEAEQEYKRLLGTKCATPAEAIAAGAAAKRQAEALAPTKQAVAKEDLVKARRLQDAGFESEARKLTKEVAENSTTPIPPRLRALNQRVGWWRDKLGVLAPAARTALEVLAVLLALLLALLLSVTGVAAVARRFKLSGQLTGFAGAADVTLPPVLGAALSGMLARMSDEGATRRVDWQSGTEFKFELPPSLGEVLPQANLLSGLVQMLDGVLYRRLFIISGTVHPVHRHRGAGVTLVVTNRNGSKSEQVTLWEREFLLKEAGADVPDAVRFERLMLPAAVWLAYRPMIGFKERKQLPLHTRDWRSYALFALAELVPDVAKERRLYELALDRDCDNLGARLNLAALLLCRPLAEVPSTDRGDSSSQTPPATSSRESWDEFLTEAGVQLDYVTLHTSSATDPIWYRSIYMGAVRAIYLGNGALVKEKLAKLTTQMEKHGKEKRLEALIDALKQPVEVLKQTALLLSGGVPDEAGVLAGRCWLTATAEYNQACFWSRYAGVPEQQAKKVERTAKAVRSLRRAIEREQRLRAEAAIDPAFDPIRGDAAFKVVTEAPKDEAPVEKPTRYAVTLDPGPELLRAARAAKRSD